MKEYGLFIDGKWQSAEGGATYETINPATGKPWATAAAAQPADLDRAVESARRAFDSGEWRNTPPAKRAEVLHRAAELIIERQEELVAAEIADSGSTLRKANTADITATMQTFQYYAELAETLEDEVVQEEFMPVSSRNIVRREPVGVVGAIVPWNFPMPAATWKVAPALAAGCTIVIKPSPYTPVTTALLAEICSQAGVPDGVFNVVTGPDNALGSRLVEHPAVDKVAFTGSTAVGRKVMHSCAAGLKHVTLELGGKSANIILEDANLETAVVGSLFGTFFHSGQICSSGTRILVPKSIHGQFVERMVEATKRITIGDPTEPETTMGPLISQRQLANVERYVGLGREAGAKPVCGGKRPEGLPEALAGGYFYEPTILVAVTNDMTVAREEIFGPVVCVIAYEDEEEALAIANDSPYGLAGAVWSDDIERASAMARRIQAGTVWINDYHLLQPKYPFGGYKQSGFGRELGPEGLSEYQQIKHIHVGESADVDEKYYVGLLLD